MSLPSFPNKDSIPSREEAINQIISSIAMEELGLSHIINAEGEKMQYALGTLPGQNGPEEPLTIEKLIELNNSIHRTLDSSVMNQVFLKEKLQNALSASVMRGPTGPEGPMTTILNSYDTIDQLIAAHPTGNPGDAYLVGGDLYVWDDENNEWKNVGNLTGPMGPLGPIGPVGAILDYFETLPELIDAHATGTQGDTYLVGGELYVWDEGTGTWKPVGNLIGPTGPNGASAYEVAREQGFIGTEEEWLESLVGPTGPIGVILDSVSTTGDLPTGAEQGDAYLVGGDLYVWIDGQWEHVGNLLGPAEPQGEPGKAVGTIVGVVDTVGDLPDTGQLGELLIVLEVIGSDLPHLFVWNDTLSDWEQVGPFEGVIGPTGPVEPVILGKQTACKNAVMLNRF